VREKTIAVQVRSLESFLEIFDTVLLREVPAATHSLPSLALSVEGGGRLALNPQSKDEPQTFNSLFQFDIALPVQFSAEMMGGRAYVRFVYPDEPLAWQWYRQLRQTFLSVLHV